MVVVDTIGAIAVGGGETFTWLVVLFVTFFIPSALISAELGTAIPEEGGAYVWVRRAFGRYAGALTSLLYWAGTPMWLGGSVAVVAMAVYQQFLGGLSLAGLYLFGTVFIAAGHGGCDHPAAVRQVDSHQRRDRADRAAGVLHHERRPLRRAARGARHLRSEISARPVRRSSPSSRCCCIRSSGSNCPLPPPRR